MESSGMLRSVALVRTDVSEEISAAFIRVNLVFLRSVHRLLVTASVVRSSQILVTLMKEALSSSETSKILKGSTLRKMTKLMMVIFSFKIYVITRVTWSHIPGYGTLHSNHIFS
jgi:hypothetical protein